MNFKIYSILIFLLLGGCGVKAKPLRPPETAVQSYIDSYIVPVEKESSAPKTEKKK